MGPSRSRSQAARTVPGQLGVVDCDVLGGWAASFNF